MSGIVMQVNRKPETSGQHGLPKVPADAVRVTYHGLEGDYNRFRTYAKGSDPARAVMVMPLETLRELNAEGWPVQPGDMGENITSQGIPYDDFVIGGRYQVGEAVIEIAEPCLACMNLAALPFIGEEKGPSFIRTLTRMEGNSLFNRRGWYAAVVQEGVVSPGDAITPMPAPVRS